MLRLLGVIGLAGLLGGCERHVALKFPDSSPGAAYVCSVTDRSVERCAPATNIDPADSDRAGTVFVILPRECQGRFNEIVIHDSGSSQPSVSVRCAPLENRIE